MIIDARNGHTKIVVLDEETVSELRGYDIYLVGWSEEYLERIVKDFSEIISDIKGILAKYPLDSRTIKSVFVGADEYEIQYISQIENKDKQKSKFVILDRLVSEAIDLMEEFAILDEVFWCPSTEDVNELQYRDYYKDHELEDVIIFRSGPATNMYVKGMDFYDNSLALFEYMIQNGYNDKWKLVWIVKDPLDDSYKEYRDLKNVDFVSFDWRNSTEKNELDAYYIPLCLARYIFFTDSYGFANLCRRDQIRVQLWHGNGVKGRTRYTSAKYRYEYLTVISDFYAGIYTDEFRIDRKNILVTGYPKNDWVVNSDPSTIKKRLGIQEYDKYILWLPTFRKGENVRLNRRLGDDVKTTETGFQIIETQKQLYELNDFLKKENTCLLIKPHPYQDLSVFSGIDSHNILFLSSQDLFDRSLQVNQIMSVFDAMITDYSSAATDYLLLDRPMGFTLDDLDQYESIRDFNVHPVQDYLPGAELYDFDDFKRFISEIIAGVDSSIEKRHRLRSFMHDYLDGNSSKRVLDALKIYI